MKLGASWLRRPEIDMLHDAFARAGYELRFVGGCVRDTILGLRVREMDAATNAMPDQVMALLEAAKLRAIPTGIKHGTVTAIVGGHSFEITTLRRDIATDGRHAKVLYTDNWEEDAKRRDFTMNALYLDFDGNLYDYVGGYKDCKERHVRFIGDAEARIIEDYLRIMRYFRFVARVGNNEFDDAALAACNAQKRNITTLSGERIASELLKLLVAEKSYVAVLQLYKMDILRFILPLETIICEPLGKLDGCEADPLVKLAGLIGNSAHVPAVADALKLSGRQRSHLELWLSNYKFIHPGMSELEQKKLVRKLGSEHYLYTIQLAYAFSGKLFAEFHPLAAMSQWQPPPLPISAEDLMQLGFSEGKLLGDRLRELEHIWEESGYRLNREELLIAQPDKN